MPDPRDFLPQPPWEGLPIPKAWGRVRRGGERNVPRELQPPGWQPRRPYPDELSYGLTPEQEEYLVASVADVIYRGVSHLPEQSEAFAIRYAEADLWVSIGKEKAREIVNKAYGNKSRRTTH